MLSLSIVAEVVGCDSARLLIPLMFGIIGIVGFLIAFRVMMEVMPVRRIIGCIQISASVGLIPVSLELLDSGVFISESMLFVWMLWSWNTVMMLFNIFAPHIFEESDSRDERDDTLRRVAQGMHKLGLLVLLTGSLLLLISVNGIHFGMLRLSSTFVLRLEVLLWLVLAVSYLYFVLGAMVAFHGARSFYERRKERGKCEESLCD